MPQTFDCSIHWNTWQLRAHNLIQVNFRVFVIVQFPASATGKTEWDEHLGAEAVKEAVDKIQRHQSRFYCFSNSNVMIF